MGIFDREKRDVDSAIETIKTEHAELQQKLVEREKDIERLRNRIAELESQQNVPETPYPTNNNTPIPTPVPTEPTPVVGDQVFKAIIAALEELKTQQGEYKAQVDELKAQCSDIKVLVAHRDTQDENMRVMHKEMEQYKADFYAKITKPFLLSLLDLHYRFFSSARPYIGLEEQEGDLKENYKKLMEQFQVAIKAISDRIYNDFGIEDFTPNEGDAFDARGHQIMETVLTNDNAKHRTVASVICGGFRDMDTLKIIRPARIVCYKFTEEPLQQPEQPAEEKPAEVPAETPSETPEA